MSSRHTCAVLSPDHLPSTATHAEVIFCAQCAHAPELREWPLNALSPIVASDDATLPEPPSAASKRPPPPETIATVGSKNLRRVHPGAALPLGTQKRVWDGIRTRETCAMRT